MVNYILFGVMVNHGMIYIGRSAWLKGRATKSAGAGTDSHRRRCIPMAQWSSSQSRCWTSAKARPGQARAPYTNRFPGGTTRCVSVCFRWWRQFFWQRIWTSFFCQTWFVELGKKDSQLNDRSGRSIDPM